MIISGYHLAVPNTPRNKPMRHLGPLAAVLSTAALLLGPGCAVQRPTLQTDELKDLHARYVRMARADTRIANDKILRRMSMECDAAKQRGDADSAVYDILILSGGGDYGAFGAGFLKGWGTVAQGPTRRPVFDMVTGVSTGALIAPFAFLGDDPSYDRLVDLYSTPKKDWFTSRGLLFFLPGNESFLDNRGLRRDLEANIDDSVIKRIAIASRENRVLAVNTTNLDVGALHPFEVSAEAENAELCDDRKRIIDILMASAAIPAVFPPVIIDGALYVDGGCTTNILYGANWLSPKAPIARWQAMHPGQPLPRMRFWVVINNQLGTGAQIVQPTWLSITRASLATGIRSSTTVALRHLFSQCQSLRAAGVDAEFRYVSIPSDWVPPNDRQFDEQVMASLAALGMKMGSDPDSWRIDFGDERARPTAEAAAAAADPAPTDGRELPSAAGFR